MSPASTTPVAVVFDIGGVLLDWNPRHLYRRLFSDERAMERFLAEVCTLQWHEAHDLGTPFAVSCERLAAEHPEQAELIRAWGTRSEEMIRGPIDGTVAVLRELLERGVRCVGLTNMEAETYALRYRRYEFLRRLEGIVVSSHEGVAKPDPEIFRRLLERFGLEPRRTVFVDDSRRNVDAARRFGIRTVRFRSPAQLRRRLVAYGLL
jgi:2-haloacid dehalogenase